MVVLVSLFSLGFFFYFILKFRKPGSLEVLNSANVFCSLSAPRPPSCLTVPRFVFAMSLQLCRCHNDLMEISTLICLANNKRFQTPGRPDGTSRAAHQICRVSASGIPEKMLSKLCV